MRERERMAVAKPKKAFHELVPPRLAYIYWRELGKDHMLKCREVGMWSDQEKTVWEHMGWVVVEHVFVKGEWQQVGGSTQVKEIREWHRFEEARTNPKEEQPLQLSFVAA